MFAQWSRVQIPAALAFSRPVPATSTLLQQLQQLQPQLRSGRRATWSEQVNQRENKLDLYVPALHAYELGGICGIKLSTAQPTKAGFRSIL